MLDEPPLQDHVDALIVRFKVDGFARATLQHWERLSGYLEAAGVSQVVLACTDLAFCATADRGDGLQMFGSSVILAEALVDEFCRLEGLPRTPSQGGESSR